MRSFSLTHFEGVLSYQGCGRSHALGHCDDCAASTSPLCRLTINTVLAHTHCGLGKIQKFLLGETVFALRYSAT